MEFVPSCFVDFFTNIRCQWVRPFWDAKVKKRAWDAAMFQSDLITAFTNIRDTTRKALKKKEKEKKQASEVCKRNLNLIYHCLFSRT